MILIFHSAGDHFHRLYGPYAGQAHSVSKELMYFIVLYSIVQLQILFIAKLKNFNISPDSNCLLKEQSNAYWDDDIKYKKQWNSQYPQGHRKVFQSGAAKIEIKSCLCKRKIFSPP